MTNTEAATIQAAGSSVEQTRIPDHNFISAVVRCRTHSNSPKSSSFGPGPGLS